MTQQPVRPDRARRLAVLGGWLVVVGCLLMLATVGIATIGQPVAIGGAGIGGVVLAFALAALAAGFALLAIAGPASIGGLSVRLGLALLAIGLAGIVASSVIAGGLTYDPLEELAFVVPFLLGGFATIVGIPFTLVGLLLHPGTPRRIAAAFLGGLAVIVLGGMLSNAMLAGDPGASSVPMVAGLVAAVGLGLVLLSICGLGVAAIRGTAAREDVAGGA